MRWETRQSQHYIFRFFPNSFAAQQHDNILRLQEYCYTDILQTLQIDPLPFPIRYFLYDSSELVGRKYTEFYPDEPYSPCNGFAHHPDQIHAVYSEDIQCVGYHEDVHLIAASTLGEPAFVFIREGLAMFFDEVWWGIPNKLWTHLFLREHLYPGLGVLCDTQKFKEFPCGLTYPISGAFTEVLIRRFGQLTYQRFYRCLEKMDIEESLRMIFKTDLQTIEQDFIQHINHSHYTSELYRFALDSYHRHQNSDGGSDSMNSMLFSR